MFEVASPTKKKKFISGITYYLLLRLWVFICCNELFPRGCWWWGGSVEIMSGERGRAAPGGCSGEGRGEFWRAATCLSVLSPYSCCAHMV